MQTGVVLIIYQITIAQSQVEYPSALSVALVAVWSCAWDSWMLFPCGALSFSLLLWSSHEWEVLTGENFAQVDERALVG